MDTNCHVTYLGHSGFCVQMGKLVLIFDYFQGEIPEFNPDCLIYIFASHRHRDHYNTHIFSLYETYNHVFYILSSDIGKKYKKKYLMQRKGLSEACYHAICWLAEDMEYRDESVEIRTLPSTDEGVAFLVKNLNTGLIIYHAGDLNWWTWEGESREEYEVMTQKFFDAIKRLEEVPIEIAFLPLDPRQGERFYLGFDYTMRHAPIKQVYPMHCWNNFSVISQLEQMDCSEEYRNRIVPREFFEKGRV